jgi:hypothetical protein
MAQLHQLLIECAACLYGNSATELQVVVNEAHAGFFVTHYADELSWHAAFRAVVSSSSSNASSSSVGATKVEAVGLVQDLILLLHQVALNVTTCHHAIYCTLLYKSTSAKLATFTSVFKVR